MQCDSNICISADLVCDGVSHCGHGEDEAACSGDGMFSLLGLQAEQVSAILLLIVVDWNPAW